MVGAASAQSADPPLPPGALSPANLAKPRPKAPFDMTGTWQHELRGPQSWKFVPPTFELTPEAQVHYDAGRKPPPPRTRSTATTSASAGRPACR